MARAKTTAVQEQRLTFGDLERRELRSLLKIQKRDKTIDSIGKTAKGVAIAGVAAGAVYVGYLGVLAFASVKDGADDIAAKIKKTAQDVPISFWNWTAGSRSQIDPETGLEMIIPKSVMTETGQVVENPAYLVPGFGGLTYLGMLVGNKFNPVTAAGYNPNVTPDPPAVSETGSSYGPHVPGHPNHDAWLAGDYELTDDEYFRQQAAAHAAAIIAQREALQAAEAARLAAEAAARQEELDRLREEQGYDEDFIGPVMDMDAEEEARAERAAAEAAAAAADAERQRYYEEQRAAHAAELEKQK